MPHRTLAPVAALVSIVGAVVSGCSGGTETESSYPSAGAGTAQSSSPTPASLPSTTIEGDIAYITVFKVWDADGNLTTTDDRKSFEFLDFPAGEYPLEFGLDLAVDQGPEPDVTTLPLDGVEQTVFMFEYEGDGPTATVTEIRKDDSDVIGGHCADVETNEIVGGLDGDAVTFDVRAGHSYGCTFFNTPVPTLNMGG